MDISQFNIGQCYELNREITEDDINMFAKATGDFNYIHMDDSKAKNTIFKGRIAHGLLTAGLISNIIGTKLPGEGSIYMGQNLKFIKPVRINDIIKAKVVISSIDIQKRIVLLDTMCFNQYDEKVLDGEAKVKVL